MKEIGAMHFFSIFNIK